MHVRVQILYIQKMRMQRHTVYCSVLTVSTRFVRKNYSCLSVVESQYNNFSLSVHMHVHIQVRVQILYIQKMRMQRHTVYSSVVTVSTRFLRRNYSCLSVAKS